MNKVYMDNAATTAMRKEVLDAMLPYMTTMYGNPSSIHSFGRDAKLATDKARAQIASVLNCLPDEIIFTGGGSEADNMAIKGTASRLALKGKHIITSAVEHHAVLHTCAQLEKQGFEVTYLPVDGFGMVSPTDLEAAIRPDTILVTIMYANNEMGTIMPIKELAEVAHKHKVLFHTDAVQAVCHIPIDVKAEGIDMLSLSGHKFHGPKGIGALYIRRGVSVDPLISGGAQERNRRAGTENVPAIVGMGYAAEIAASTMIEDGVRLTKLRDRMISYILENIPYVKLNGHPTKRLPGNVNVSIEYIEGEAIAYHLSDAGICISTGSACASGSLDPSHVIRAMGVPFIAVHGSVRFSLSRYNTMEEVDYVLEKLPPVVKNLRGLSPFGPDRDPTTYK